MRSWLRQLGTLAISSLNSKALSKLSYLSCLDFLIGLTGTILDWIVAQHIQIFPAPTYWPVSACGTGIVPHAFKSQHSGSGGRRSGAEGHSGLYSKFQTSLGSKKVSKGRGTAVQRTNTEHCVSRSWAECGAGTVSARGRIARCGDSGL